MVKLRWTISRAELLKMDHSAETSLDRSHRDVCVCVCVGLWDVLLQHSPTLGGASKNMLIISSVDSSRRSFDAAFGAAHIYPAPDGESLLFSLLASTAAGACRCGRRQGRFFCHPPPDSPILVTFASVFF